MYPERWLDELEEKIEAQQAEIERLRAAAEDALGTLEAIELLDARRFGLKTEALKASCDKLHAALRQKEG